MCALKLTKKYVVKIASYMFEYVPDHLKTQDMCNNAVARSFWMLEYVPDRFKTQDMCIDAVKVNYEIVVQICTRSSQDTRDVH